MSLAIKSDVERFTYADYLGWPDDERWELIHGKAYDMSPAPSRRHQKLSGELYRQFANYLLDKSCEVYPAPFDIRFPLADEKEEDISTILQPDISVICDLDKLDEEGCLGGPDLVIEISSPSTAEKDMTEKMDVYEEAGVKEYWVVQPAEKIVMVFHLQANKLYGKPKVYSFKHKVNVGILPDLTIDLTLLGKI
ncbi:MAG: Uma2 family endonuclease [bacterium]|nr:Uma2 family endonuclease [bacterium]